jgi:hypothetical protein
MSTHDGPRRPRRGGLYLCFHHNADGDERGWINKEPEITCQACRAQGYFAEEEIEEYVRTSYKRVAIYRRRTGYPDTLHVILDDDDSIFEAERIAPRGTFRFKEIRFHDPHLDGANTRVLDKPRDGKTLHDTRHDWDRAPASIRDEPGEGEHGPQSYVVNVTPAILNLLKLEYKEIFNISPEEFEILILDRLAAMGLAGERVGATNARDGGIDIVFWPKPPFAVPFLAAAQVKHHRSSSNKTTVKPIREFAGVLRPPFNFGMVVTNTTFTADAEWFAAQKEGLLRLRDMHDLRRWIGSEFGHGAEWREIPKVVEVARGHKVNLTVGNLILPGP